MFPVVFVPRAAQAGVIQTKMNSWTKWERFPDPREKEFLVAPLGPGVYELRLKRTGRFVLLGKL